MATLAEIVSGKAKKGSKLSTDQSGFAPNGANKAVTSGVSKVGVGLSAKLKTPTSAVVAAAEQPVGISKIGYGLEKVLNKNATSAAKTNENILAGLGLDTALTPKKKKKAPDTVLSAQTEIVNRLGE